MPHTTLNALPWVLKTIAVIVGALLALSLSGDIDKSGKLNLSISVLIKFLSSTCFGLFGGNFIVEYWQLDYSSLTQSFISMIVSVFALLAIGIVYQAIKLMEGKSLTAIISDVKEAFKAIFR